MKCFRVAAVAAVIFAGALTAKADLPFRNHRYDSFKASPVTSQNIVFMGNSITNMNEWRECFGNDPRIINRGNSGAVSQELLDNIGPIVAGKPAKIFIGIGTNDLGGEAADAPQKVAANIRKVIDRFQAESPQTEIYIQSILPSSNGRRTPERTAQTNALIKAECDATGVTFINLFDAMQGILNKEISYDCLHITAKGYKIWCDIIAPYVGVPCSYPVEFEENNAGMKYSYGMRATSWSVEEVKPSDVLFIGDEMVHGGEWGELFNTPDVKNRGINWGYGGLALSQWAKNIEAILHTNPELKQQPRMIVLNLGLAEVNGKQSLDEAITAYRTVIDSIRRYAPNTQLVITSQLPTDDLLHNATRVTPFNARLRQLAAQLPGVQYVDLNGLLLGPDGKARADMFKDRYVYARGYNAIARALAPVIGNGARALTAQEFEDYYRQWGK